MEMRLRLNAENVWYADIDGLPFRLRATSEVSLSALLLAVQRKHPDHVLTFAPDSFKNPFTRASILAFIRFHLAPDWDAIQEALMHPGPEQCLNCGRHNAWWDHYLHGYRCQMCDAVKSHETGAYIKSRRRR